MSSYFADPISSSGTASIKASTIITPKTSAALTFALTFMYSKNTLTEKKLTWKKKSSGEFIQISVRTMGKSRNKNKGGPRVNPIAFAANGAPKIESDEEALNQIYSELTAGMGMH